MSDLTKLLNDLVVGKVTVTELTDALREFDWQPQSVANSDAAEDPAPTENSFDEVQSFSALTSEQYARLAAAYREAVDGAFTEVLAAGGEEHLGRG